MSVGSILDGRLHVVLAGLICGSLPITWSNFASAQFVTGVPTQAELLKLPDAEQSAQLADVMRRADRKCARARASLQQTYKEGTGGWLVECDEGQDYWVVMPAETGKAATTLPCILLRTTTGVDCYANLRTVRPEYAEQCTKSPHPDRVISACTAILQSGRAAGKPNVQAILHATRGVAMMKYQQFDLALADFDRAAALDPSNVNGLYNRAVTLQRKGDYDQAIKDLDKTVQLAPTHPLANYERGFLYLKKANYDQAIADFDKAIRINPAYAKSYRDRGAAYKAKGDSAKAEADFKKAKELDPSITELALAPSPPAPAKPAPAKPAPAQEKDTPTETDKQAAYCMEASFGYASRYSRLVLLLQQNLKTAEGALRQPDLPDTAKAQISAQTRSLRDEITSSEAKKKQWQDNTGVYIEYLKRRGLLGGDNLPRLGSTSEGVAKDQQAVSEMYSSCLRQCTPNDQSCRQACDNKANASDASKRMLRCEQIAANFK